jgi:hypothetical protein
VRLSAVGLALVVSAALSVVACTANPTTYVVFDNDYPPSATKPMVVYRAYWQAVPLQDAIAPGSSSEPQSTLPGGGPVVPASDNTAYVILAPGWDLTSSTPPTSFVFLQSRSGFAVHLGDTLHIPVDDATFVGNCAAGSFLSQAEADFINERIFTPSLFPDAAASSLRYDAATCTTTPLGDAGGD